jgi:hypothetical protein
MKNILIVENDLRFVMWLSGALVAAKQQPWPACTVSDAMVLVQDPVTPIDVLIINSSLPDASKLIALLRRSQARLKVIALEARGKVQLPRVNVWCRKPKPADKSAKQEWLEVVNQM